ncbi:MAG TPA: APC family permease [Rubrobacteraceae bacterium]|nr:APC family permease [Rubrobacteraceae bacterium]
MTTEVGSTVDTERPHLRRGLRLWEAVGISLALMAPSMAANINPQGTAGSVGRAVPLAFALATVGVLLIAWTFVRLTQRFNHAGSVYGFVGATLGPRAGVVSGWALMGTYTFYGVVTAVAAGIFGADFLDRLGLWTNQPEWAPFIVGAIALAGVWALAASNVKEGTRVLLVIEALTVGLILVVSVIILARLATGTAPNGNTVDFSVFSIPPGTGASAVFLGVVFGFLSFAGFEAAATLGEETQEPRRDIPRAILGVAIFGGLYFVFVTAVEVMAFGADARGVESFIASGSLLGDLGSQFVAGWVGELITLGAAVSAFACALACVVGATRLLYALSRDEVGPPPLGTVSARNGVPVRSTAAITLCVYVLIVVCWLLLGVAPFDAFVAWSTIGTLILLLVYALATVGAARMSFFSGERRVAAWEVVVPFLALLLIGYTLFRNIYPYPTDAARWYPIIAAVWIVVGIIVTFVRSAATRRAGERLMVEEGLAAEGGSATQGSR